MDALISEMTMILEQLSSNMKVGVTAFSSGSDLNNKWRSEPSPGLARLGDDGKRDSAIEFMDILDNQRVTKLGGTDPWKEIQQAFDDTKTDKMWIMSGGRTNQNRNCDLIMNTISKSLNSND